MICKCAELEWLPEHYQMEHHPKCKAYVQAFVDGVMDSLHRVGDLLNTIEPYSDDAKSIQSRLESLPAVGGDWWTNDRPINLEPTIWKYTGAIDDGNLVAEGEIEHD